MYFTLSANPLAVNVCVFHNMFIKSPQISPQVLIFIPVVLASFNWTSVPI
jgi:hypothetical protein